MGDIQMIQIDKISNLWSQNPDMILTDVKLFQLVEIAWKLKILK